MSPFVAKPAAREQIPIMVGLVGPSGGGKTWSALRLATGIQRVCSGPIVVIDTENKRALHYADDFKFEHIDFTEPFGSLRYHEALTYALTLKPSVIVVDSCTHEHEAFLEHHEAVLDRMAGNNWDKRAQCQMVAWAEPKGHRRKLLSLVRRLPCNAVFCFRAHNSTKPVKKGGKTEVVPQGFVPVGAPEWTFEMMVNVMLLPKSGGIPTWQSEYPGESSAMKLPRQFVELFSREEPLSEDIGQRMAEWAAGSSAAAPPGKQAKALEGRYAEVFSLENWEQLEVERKALWNKINAKGKEALKAASDAAKTRLDSLAPSLASGGGYDGDGNPLPPLEN